MSANSVTVSVIIPVYNGSQYVKTAIDSVLEQTFRDVEIIVVDDGSTDNSKSVVSPYVQSGRVKYLYQANGGLSAARNAGIRAASGKYFKFLDCDDYLFPRQLELQVAHLKGKQNVLSVSDHVVRSDDGKEKTKKINLGTGNQLARLISGNFPVHNVLVEAEPVVKAGGFDVELRSLEDADLWLRLLLEGAKIEKVDYVGCCYRIVDNSLSSNIDNMFFMRCKTSEKLNGTLLPSANRLDPEISAALLTVNNKLLEGCFARNLKPGRYLSKTLACTQILLLRTKTGWRKSVFRLIGCQLYMFLKYHLNCFRHKDYQNSILLSEIKWRKLE